MKTIFSTLFDSNLIKLTLSLIIGIILIGVALTTTGWLALLAWAIITFKTIAVLFLVGFLLINRSLYRKLEVERTSKQYAKTLKNLGVK
jgi:hypothetical protein